MNTSKALWVALAALFASSAFAQDAISSRMEAYRVVVSGDAEKFEPAATASPGDVIEYQIVYDNAGTTAVSDLKVNGPVPSGTQYVDGSARTAVRSDTRFSYDGGASWHAAPVMRKTADGKRQEVVPASHYSNVQWIAKEALQKGGSQKYSYRVRVSTDAPPAHSASSSQ